jgi:hypothetical protein
MVKRLHAAVVQRLVGLLHEDSVAYRHGHARPHHNAYCVALGGVAGLAAHFSWWAVLRRS